MNPNNETWQNRAKRLIELKNNQIADSNTIRKLKESLMVVNISGISDEDYQLLKEAIN